MIRDDGPHVRITLPTHRSPTTRSGFFQWIRIKRPRSDSNRRITDLQSVPLDHSGTRPHRSCLSATTAGTRDTPELRHRNSERRLQPDAQPQVRTKSPPAESLHIPERKRPRSDSNRRRFPNGFAIRSIRPLWYAAGMSIDPTAPPPPRQAFWVSCGPVLSGPRILLGAIGPEPPNQPCPAPDHPLLGRIAHG